MKKIKLLSIAVLAFLTISIITLSCKKDTEDPNLTYIKDFYGVNVVHSFVCLNPTNDSKSLRVDLVWDEMGVATYTTTDIPRDTAGEHNSRLFMPASEFNSEDGTVTPTKPVKMFMLVFENGSIEVLENYTCNGIWTWTCSNSSCGSGGFLIIQGLNSWVECRDPANPSIATGCPATWYCDNTGKLYDDYFIGWQAL